MIKAAVVKEKASFDTLFITIHHLLIDGVSWRILLEDLYTIYDALEKKEAIKVPQKTATMIDWRKKLVEYSESEGLKIEKVYWNDINRLTFTIPQDFETDDWRIGSLNKVSAILNKEETDFLLRDANQTYKTNTSILLNVALALTLKTWTGLSSFIIEQENHGRHLETVDTSRTIGWFTAMYPIKLELKDESLGKQIKAIKEQIRKVPFHGIGYGIGKYFSASNTDNGSPLSEIRFNYLGQFDRELNNELLSYCHEYSGSDIDPLNKMTVKLELNAMIIDGTLTLEINYNRKAHKEATMNWFMENFFNNLVNILTHLRNEEEVHFTPSDFGATGLNEEDLIALFG